MEIPFSDCDSLCSTSLTSTFTARSELEVMRCSISWGCKPVKLQTRLITGISMLGKISVGVRNSTTGVSNMITRAITINVYGLESAKRTIHILSCDFPQRAGGSALKPVSDLFVLLSLDSVWRRLGYASFTPGSAIALAEM